MSYKILKSEYQKLLSSIYRYNNKIMKKLSPNYEHEYIEEIWAASAYLSVFSIAKNIIYLLGNKNPITIPSLVRDCLDSHINLLNIITRYDYFVMNEKNLLQKRIKKLKDFIKYESSNLTSHQINMIINLINEYNNNLNQLKNIKSTSIKEVEKRNGIDLDKPLMDFYVSLCGHSHNDNTVLVQRHIEPGTKGCTINIKKIISNDIIKICLLYLFPILINSILKYRNYLRHMKKELKNEDFIILSKKITIHMSIIQKEIFNNEDSNL